MKTVSADELQAILARHKQWLAGADPAGRADLRDADLSGADLRDAVLSGADLSDADLSDADLTPIRNDLWAVLSSCPAEAAGLRAALAEGRVAAASTRRGRIRGG